jgi:hypothetical protein
MRLWVSLGAEEFTEKTNEDKNKSSKGRTQTESRKSRVIELKYTANLVLDRC